MAAGGDGLPDTTAIVMEYKDSLERFKKIQKPKLVLGILEALMDVSPITLEILKVTCVGKTVNGFRKNEGEVGQVARTLIAKWKDLAVDAINLDKIKREAEKSLKKRAVSAVDSSSINKQLTEHYKVKQEVKTEKIKLESQCNAVRSKGKEEKCSPTKDDTSPLGSKPVKKEATSPLDSKSIKKEATSSLDSKSVKREATSSLDSKSIKKEATSSLDSKSVKKEATSSLDSKSVKKEDTSPSDRRPIKKEKGSKHGKKKRRHSSGNSADDQKKIVCVKNDQPAADESFEVALLGKSTSPKGFKIANKKEKDQSSHVRTKETQNNELSVHVGKESSPANSEENTSVDETIDPAKVHESISFANIYKTEVAPPVKPASSSKSSEVLNNKTVPASKPKKTIGLAQYKLLHNVKKEKDSVAVKDVLSSNADVEVPMELEKTVDIRHENKMSAETMPEKLVSGSDSETLVEEAPSLTKLQSDLDYLMSVVSSKSRKVVKQEGNLETMDTIALTNKVKIESSDSCRSLKAVNATEKSESKNIPSSSNEHYHTEESSDRRNKRDRPQSSKSTSMQADANEPLKSANSHSQNVIDYVEHAKHSSHSPSHKHNSDNSSDARNLTKHSAKTTSDRSSGLPKSYKKSDNYDGDRRKSANHSEKRKISPNSSDDESYEKKHSKRSSSDDHRCSLSKSKKAERLDRHDGKSDKLSPRKHSDKHRYSTSNHGDEYSERNSGEKSSSSNYRNSYGRDERSNKHGRNDKSHERDRAEKSSVNSRKDNEDPVDKSNNRPSKYEKRESSNNCDRDVKSDRFSATKLSDKRKMPLNTDDDDDEEPSDRKCSKRSSSDRLKCSTSNSERYEKSDKSEGRSARKHSDRNSNSFADVNDGDQKSNRYSPSKSPYRHQDISDDRNCEKKSVVHTSSKHSSLHKSASKTGSHKSRESSHDDSMERSRSSHKKHKHHSRKDGSAGKRHKHSKEKSGEHANRKRKSTEQGADAESGQSFGDLMSNVAYPEQPKKKKPTTLEQKIAKTVSKAPLPQSYLDDLPELVAEYKPLPKISQGFTSSQSCAGGPTANLDLTFSDIKASSRADAVYSGRRRGNTTMVSLADMCLNVLGNNIDDIGYVGGVPYSILESVLKKATPKQLLTIEDYNVEFTQDSDPLWKDHCGRDFKGQKADEFESHRELYLRKYEEREKKFEMLQTKISAREQQKQNDTRKSLVAYTMSSMPKPPREVRRQQAKYGTGSGTIESTARAAAIFKHENSLKPYTSSRDSSSSSRDSKSSVKLISVPPLMKKAKKFMSKLNR